LRSDEGCGAALASGLGPAIGQHRLVLVDAGQQTGLWLTLLVAHGFPLRRSHAVVALMAVFLLAAEALMALIQSVCLLMLSWVATAACRSGTGALAQPCMSTALRHLNSNF